MASTARLLLTVEIGKRLLVVGPTIEYRVSSPHLSSMIFKEFLLDLVMYRRSHLLPFDRSKEPLEALTQSSTMSSNDDC